MGGTQGVEKRVRSQVVAALTALLLALPGSVVAATCPVAPELWDRPRSGAAVAAEPSIKPCIEEMLRLPQPSLEIRYGAGADLLAEEMRAWLIALALDARRIMLVPDVAAPAGGVILAVRGQP